MQSKKPIKHVTNRQGGQFATIARNSGLSRDALAKFLKDPKKSDLFFAEISKPEDEWLQKMKASARKAGFLFHCVTIVVDYARSYKSAAMAGGPDTYPPDTNLENEEFDFYYQIPEKKKVIETIVMLNNGPNFQQLVNYHSAVRWALENGLRQTTPHVPFAVAERFPNLAEELKPGYSPLYVIETTRLKSRHNGDMFHWGVGWNNGSRTCKSGHDSGICGNANWYTFCK